MIKIKKKDPATGKKVVLPAGESAAIIAGLIKKRGASVVLRGSDVPLVERIGTGVFEIDMALGGGFPKARMSMVYGPEGSGKSNLCACVAAVCQKTEPAECNRVVWVDLEGTMDPTWMAKFGIDMDDLIVVKPSFGEEAADIVDALTRASDVALIIVDSLAILSSAKEGGNAEGSGQSMENFDVGSAALLAKRMVNKLCWAFAAENARGHRPTIIFINQTRFKIGVKFGDPETMPGGNSPKFNSALTVRLSRDLQNTKIDKALHPTMPVFNATFGRVKKSKVPVRQIEFHYDLCVLPVDKGGVTIRVGESDSWGLIKMRLQAGGELAPAKPKGWSLFGKTYDTQEPLRQLYYNDKAFQHKCQQAVLEKIKDVIMTVEAEGAAATKMDVQKESWFQGGAGTNTQGD